MTNSMKTATDRREFWRGGARYALLASMSAVASLVATPNNGRPTGQSCIQQGICRGCTAVDDCGLPQALSFKQALKGRG